MIKWIIDASIKDRLMILVTACIVAAVGYFLDSAGGRPRWPHATAALDDTLKLCGGLILHKRIAHRTYPDTQDNNSQQGERGGG